jgi:hypothetical protein
MQTPRNVASCGQIKISPINMCTRTPASCTFRLFYMFDSRHTSVRGLERGPHDLDVARRIERVVYAPLSLLDENLQVLCRVRVITNLSSTIVPRGNNAQTRRLKLFGTRRPHRGCM